MNLASRLRPIAAGLTGLAVAFPSGPGHAASPRELLRDAPFTQGLVLLAPQPEAGTLGVLRRGNVSEPVWQVAQWHTRFPLTGLSAAEPGRWRLANDSKWLELETPPDGPATLTLGVDSRPEYGDAPRSQASQPWVHLLVQQSIEAAPPLTELASLLLRFQVRLEHAETFRPEGYSPDLHAAQFQVVLTLNHTRRGAPGYGDYLWFVVPVYDDRHEVPPAYVAQDFAVTQGKLIYNPGGQAVGLPPMVVGEWQTVAADLRPWLERALAAAWARGYLSQGREAADYRVAHLNLGWEVPGLNRVAVRLRGLSLQATVREPGESLSLPPADAP